MRLMFNAIQGSGAVDSRIPLIDTDVNIVFDGDSLTQGINGAWTPTNDNDQYYPNKVKDWLTPLSKSVSFFSNGISGKNLFEMLGDAATLIDPKLEPLKTNICVVWEDVNSIYTGDRTGAQTYSDMVQYVTDRKTAGWDYVFIMTTYWHRTPTNLWTFKSNPPTYIDISGILIPALKAQCDIYYDAIYATANPLWDAAYDLRNAPNIGGAYSQGWTQYPPTEDTYFKDYVHLQAAGYDIVADAVINELIGKFFK
tara:strand:- start:34 stop:795 length:762 start_codon:yes stop_codon:yes gene_type:complete